jgi:peptidyl-prolyl cis-trans isomerase C
VGTFFVIGGGGTMARVAVWLSAGLLGGGLFVGGFFLGKRAAPGRAGAANDRSAVIASFAGGKVTADELRAAVEEQGPLLRGSFTSVEARRRLVGELIRQQILEKASREKGYDATPEIVREHHRALVALYLRKEFEEPESKAQVSDDDLRAFLERHKADYERPERVRIADLFVAAPQAGAERRKKAAEAEGLLRRLAVRGAKDRYAFANLARERSDDVATRSFGGDLPVSTRAELAARLGPEVTEAAFALRGNETLGDKVIETPQGFHLLKLHAREESASADLARLRHLLRGRVIAERRVKDQEAFFAALEKNAGVRFDEEALAGLRLDKGSGPTAAR